MGYLSSLTQPDSEISETAPEVTRGRARGRGRGRGRGAAKRVISSSNVKLNEPAVSRSGRRIKPNSRWAPDSDFDPGPTKNSRANSKSKAIEKVASDSDENEHEQHELVTNGIEEIERENKEEQSEEDTKENIESDENEEEEKEQGEKEATFS